MNDSIFAPKYIVTPEISSALEDIERHRWLIDNTLLLPRHEAWLRREIQVRRVSATTRIEGASLDESEVGRLARKGALGQLSEDEQANLNALQAYEFIDYLSDQRDIPIDELVIRELNRQFMRGSSEALTPGVYRRGQNQVGSFTPPDQGGVPGLMRSFALWLRQETNIHPVLKAGIAHVHLVAIHPFWDGNGRTARGLTTLLLQRMQPGFRKFLALESYLFNIRDDYFAAIERTLGTRFALDYDTTTWIRFFTFALGAHVHELVAALTGWHRRAEDVYRIAQSRGMPSSAADACVFALQTGQITRADYMEIAGVSPVTASRHLAELVRQGILKPEGRGRNRIYRPTLADLTV